jgi:hypothetical protein
VLFGENGMPEVNYQTDAFHDDLGIAVEVEAGRGAAGNADYRDIVRTSVILDAQYVALLMPIRYPNTINLREDVIVGPRCLGSPIVRYFEAGPDHRNVGGCTGQFFGR